MAPPSAGLLWAAEYPSKELLMNFTIGKFDPVAKSVPVTFRHDARVHRRNVNACLDENGRFDKVATNLRVEEVAAGVVYKIEAGILT